MFHREKLLLISVLISVLNGLPYVLYLSDTLIPMLKYGDSLTVSVIRNLNWNEDVSTPVLGSGE